MVIPIIIPGKPWWRVTRGACKWLTVLVLCLPGPGCREQDPGKRKPVPTVVIDFSRRTQPPDETRLRKGERVFNFAVAGMTSPQSTLRNYRELLDYLGRELGIQVVLTQRRTYQEVNDLLLSGDLDAAFLCSGGYALGGRSLASGILAVPVIRGKTTYRAYIIVHRDSGIRNFSALKHHSFAFTDPLSNTGWLYPVSKLTELGTTPSSFFSEVTYTYAHDRSIDAVALRITDGASVDSLVFENLGEDDPERIANLLIIERSPEFAIPPVVASPKLDHGIEEKLRVTLLLMHQDDEGRRILRKLSIERFEKSNERFYDPIRNMAKRVGPWRP